LVTEYGSARQQRMASFIIACAKFGAPHDQHVLVVLVERAAGKIGRPQHDGLAIHHDHLVVQQHAGDSRTFAPMASSSFVFAPGCVAMPESSTITTRTCRASARRTASVMAPSVKENARIAISLVAWSISVTSAPRTSSSA
jgi:hypothetical protein